MVGSVINQQIAFSAHLPLKEPLVITHLIATILTLFACFPFLVLFQPRPQTENQSISHLCTKRQKIYYHYLFRAICILLVISSSLGLYIICEHLLLPSSTIASNTTTILYVWSFLCLFTTFSFQLFAMHYYSMSTRNKQQETDSNNSNSNLSRKKKSHTLVFLLDSSMNRFNRFLSSKKQLVMTVISGWPAGLLLLTMALNYITIVLYTLTESDMVNEGIEKYSIYPISILLGVGFLVYGTTILLHLLSVIQLPRPSTPEYYESVLLILWGLIMLCFMSTGTTIPNLGSGWRAINLGLLWFTGGIFSISLSLQTWMPFLREKNIVNALVVCLTGRAIAVTYFDDPYINECHTMLGYLWIGAATSRIIQIAFRKSPSENIPQQLLSQQSFYEDDDKDMLEDEEEEFTTAEAAFARNHKDVLGKTHRKNKCRHTVVCASITIVFGLLASILTICSGILLIGSTQGWINHIRYYISDPSTYINVMLAISFIWSAYISGLCTLYKYIKRRNKLSEYEYLELSTTPKGTSIAPYDSSHHVYQLKDQTGLLPLASLSSYRPIDQSNSDERREQHCSMTGYSLTNDTKVPSNIMPGSSDPSCIDILPSVDTTADSPRSKQHILTSTPTTQSTKVKRPKVDRIITAVSGAPFYLPTISNSTSPQTSVRTMRPSEYRAKRRSLLLQSPSINSPAASNAIFNYNNTNETSTAAGDKRFSGVGGVIPDEVFLVRKNERYHQHYIPEDRPKTHTVTITTSPSSMPISSPGRSTLIEESPSSPLPQNSNDHHVQSDYFQQNSTTITAAGIASSSASSSSISRISTGILLNRGQGQQFNHRWSHPPAPPLQKYTPTPATTTSNSSSSAAFSSLSKRTL
ncbi:hypothetical protein BDF20DRAFT_407714 [Mycotypha africana]|uniref:uncharacterized protein n=1 Tax=Mycotypha africana TaxID=64632 RepID=UPI002300A04B|nr:uncharacterized protein BDF20DRAFT_407714 [Mycotypha africana]KAI8984760.1 hypothetical protein BDF20DRAFT_407714 [Mycotypha africana]